MTRPAWAPPPLPELGEPPTPAPPSRVPAVIALAAVVAMGFGLGAVVWERWSGEDTVGPEAQQAVDLVDQTLIDIADGRWVEAHQSFDPTCTSFSLQDFRAGFEPVFSPYRGHTVLPPGAERFEADQIVLVRGEVDLGPGDSYPVRAELRFGSEPTGVRWRLCGLRIDNP
ncbi:MAG: hypothetical protein HKN24_14795 [Acidimicrobiales bacterium]|nr:hypothetical protein [Acidimicrobiales bacterium]